MSFILQFFDAVEVRSVSAAAEWVHSKAPPLARTKLDAFLSGVVTCFPDLSDADEDGDDEVNVWPEGLQLGDPLTSVINLPIKLHFVEQGILSLIAKHAVRAGLQMFDPQNAHLYRSDRVVVDADGRTSPFRGLTAFAMQTIRRCEAALAPSLGVSAAAPESLSVAGVRAQVVDKLMEKLAAVGFEHRQTERLDLLTRQHGEVRQTLVLDAGPVNADVVVRAQVWLTWPRLAKLWMSLMPPVYSAWVEQGDVELAACRYDFSLHPLSIGPEPTKPLYDLFMGYLDSAGKVRAFADGVANWMAVTALPSLEAARDLAGLSELMLSERALKRARVDPTEIAHQLGLLALAHLAADPRFETVVRALQENRYNREYGWKRFNDPSLNALNTVISELRRRPLGR